MSDPNNLLVRVEDKLRELQRLNFVIDKDMYSSIKHLRQELEPFIRQNKNR